MPSPDPFDGRTEITSEEWRAYVNGELPPDPYLTPDWQTTEKAFQAKVVAFATEHGWLSYHTWLSANSAPGFPDLVMLRGDRLEVAELKVGTNPVTRDQRRWIDAFADAGIVAHIWRPDDWAWIEEMLT